MATGGEVRGQCPSRVGSEDLDQLKCQPCLEEGSMRDAVGMCIDCQDYLCRKCFKIHTRPKPMRNHQLLDKEKMLQSQIQTSPTYVCTEKCPIHEDKLLEYYCTTHSQLGCTVCITLGHAICKGVQYIPHVAKDLTNNEVYTQVESQLKSALIAFENVADNVQNNAEELGTTCKEALEKIREYRRNVEEAFDKIEAKLVEQAKEIKSKQIKELEAIGDKFKKAHGEARAALAKIEALHKSKLNSSLYIEMMRTKDKLESMDAQIKEAGVNKSDMECQVIFSPNQETLASLQNTETFGIISGSGKGDTVNRCNNPIVSAKHARDINVKTGTDKYTCRITGLAVLPGGKLVLADSINSKIKTVNVQSGKVLAELKLSSAPWGVAAIDNNKVAVTLPNYKKIEIVTVGEINLSIERYLSVSGACSGVAYRNGKLAVSFLGPSEVLVLNLKGTVLYTISADKQGNTLFVNPQYLTFGQDDTLLYVSNYSYSNVVCMHLDGTVVATYTDITRPMEPVVDSHGNVYVCSHDSNQVHQLSKDCKKIQVLLTQADGLSNPCSICLSEEEDKLYVGMWDNDNVKVYKTERKAR